MPEQIILTFSKWRTWLWPGLATVFLLAAIWGWYSLSGQPVTVVIDSHHYQIRTRYSSVEAVLHALNLPLNEADIIQPSPLTRITPNQTITLTLALPVTVQADGETRHYFTHQPTVAAFLAEIEKMGTIHDEILLDDQPGSLQTNLSTHEDDSLPAEEVTAGSFGIGSGSLQQTVLRARPHPVKLTLQRAIPVTVFDAGYPRRFFTTAPTVQQALQAQGITLFTEDGLTPGVDAPLAPEMRIFINRSVPVNLQADGRLLNVRTLEKNVGQFLAGQGIALMGQDYSVPAENQPLSAGDTVTVVRVVETLEFTQKKLPFETNWIPDEQMDLDLQKVRQEGGNGLQKTRTRIRYENGQEIWREIEDEWLDAEPSTRIIAYGTKIKVQTLETENGPVEYWRKISMLITPYSAATSGKTPDHPRYGITRSGLIAGYGKVAVDPKVIPLMTELYIPGYGSGLAADTGGLVLGKHVDLGYDDGQPLPDLYEWRDVYVLTPIPSPDKIRYVLPNWPQR